MARRATAPLNVRISASLRRRLEEARERSGRTMTAEVETRLRAALRQTGGDGLVLLALDDGLMALLQAVTATGIYGDLEDTAIFLLRSQLLTYIENQNLHRLMARHLPEPYREAHEEIIARRAAAGLDRKR